MRIQGWSRAGVAVVVSVVSLSIGEACVGEDPVSTGSGVKPDPNVTPGEQGGRCKDGRCLSGLRCDTVNDVCLLDGDGGGGGSGTDGGGGNGDGGGGGGDAGQDGSTANPCPFDKPSADKVACIGSAEGDCALNAVCCLGGSNNTCVASVGDCTTTNGKPIRCNGKDSCSGDRCCLRTTTPLSAGSSCPYVLLRPELTKTDCLTDCDVSDYRVCRNDSECAVGGGSCRKVFVTSTEGNVELGVCL